MPKFPGSSHQQHWIFNSAVFAAKLEKKHTDHRETLIRNLGEGDYLNYLMSQEEDELLLLILSDHLIKAAEYMTVPEKVLSTGVSYLRRFFLKYATSEFDPWNLMFTALYLACKTEEIDMRSVNNFCSFFPQSDPKLILKTEIHLLSGINFQLYVFSPFKPFEFLLHDTETPEAEEPGKEFIRKSLLSAALFTETPSFLALAALYSALCESPRRLPTFTALSSKFSLELVALTQRLDEIVSTVQEAHSKLKQNEKLLSSLIKKSKGIRSKLRHALKHRVLTNA